ncbi:MAG: hypothetical protein ACRD2S_06790 [Terriglobales bacterium]
MKVACRHLCFLVLTAALVVPVAMTSTALAQDDNRQEDSQHNDKKQTRVYDRTHKDYHTWDSNEDRAYHQYLTEQHKGDVDYSKLKKKDQDQYWKWRHNHPDDDQDHH